MVKTIVFTVLFILYFAEIRSARILAFYPTPSFSHQIVFRCLTDELVKRGHHITVVTPDPKYPQGKSPQNLREIDVRNLSYTIWNDELARLNSVEHRTDLRDNMIDIFKLVSTVFKAQSQTPEFQEIMRNEEKFDLLLVEAYVKPVLVLSHVFKVPLILVSSLGGIKENYDAVGASTHVLLYPSPTRQKIYNLSYLEKLKQLYEWWNTYLIISKIDEEENKILKTLFGPDTPSIDELHKNIDMVMVNNHPFWIDNQPVPPNVVYLNGLHLPPRRPLPKDLQSFLNSSKNGVIYFSLGTNVRPDKLPRQKIEIFTKVFSELPYDILWKWNLETLPGKSDNIKISKWLPQLDVLSHPNVKLFITQAGLQSTDEAITAGVPLVGIPMLADQWYNAQKYTRHGIGVQLDMALLTEDNFRDAIEKVINDKSYKENILRVQSIIQDQPMPAADRAVWWIEYVIRHGGAKHLRAAGANLSLREYMELDLVFMVLSVIILILAISMFILYKLWKYVVSCKASNTKVKKS